MASAFCDGANDLLVFDDRHDTSLPHFRTSMTCGEEYGYPGVTTVVICLGEAAEAWSFVRVWAIKPSIPYEW